jgi:hypothetical protein
MIQQALTHAPCYKIPIPDTNFPEEPVLTLNYDTLVERCACQSIGQNTTSHLAGYNFKEAYSATLYPIPLAPAWQRMVARVTLSSPTSALSLHKLHGSINWFHTGSPGADDGTIFLVPATSWAVTDPNQDWISKAHIDCVPFIVPPLAEKLPFFGRSQIRSIWAQAGAALRIATRVFCLGYSLPETDLTMRLFLQSNTPAKSVPFYLVNKNNVEDPNLLGRFQSLSAQKYLIKADYLLDDDPIPRMVEEMGPGKLGPR